MHSDFFYVYLQLSDDIVGRLHTRRLRRYLHPSNFATLEHHEEAATNVHFCDVYPMSALFSVGFCVYILTWAYALLILGVRRAKA